MLCVIVTADKCVSHKHIMSAWRTDHISQIKNKFKYSCVEDCKVLHNTEQQSSILHDKTLFYSPPKMTSQSPPMKCLIFATFYSYFAWKIPLNSEHWKMLPLPESKICLGTIPDRLLSAKAIVISFASCNLFFLSPTFKDHSNSLCGTLYLI